MSPEVTAAACRDGAVQPPRVVLPTTTGIVYSIDPADLGNGTTAVKVTISRFYARSDPFSSSTSHRDVTVKLVREDQAWRISQPIELYTFSY